MGKNGRESGESGDSGEERERVGDSGEERERVGDREEEREREWGRMGRESGDSGEERGKSRGQENIFIILLSPPYRAMKDEDADAAAAPAGKPRPLYDIPYMFEAREFLRKKLIGKKV